LNLGKVCIVNVFRLYFFGTFNPVHQGHVTLANGIMLHLNATECVFVPTGLPPHRQTDTSLVPIEHRVAMLRLATADHPGLWVSDAEAHNRVSYTAETLQQLEGNEPPQRVSLLIGMDAFRQLPTWKHPDWLARHVYWWVMGRAYYAVPPLADDWCFTVVNTPLFPISATQVRQALSEGLPDDYPWLHPDVVRYIDQHQLYRV
jgi:nicotinate-nucleotide adenylyltransferase